MLATRIRTHTHTRTLTLTHTFTHPLSHTHAHAHAGRMHTSSLVTPSAQALKSCKNVAADSSSVNFKVTTSSQPVGDTRTALDDAGAGAAGAVPFVIAANAVATAAPSATSAMSRPSTIIAAGDFTRILLVHGRVLKYPGEEILMNRPRTTFKYIFTLIPSCRLVLVK